MSNFMNEIIKHNPLSEYLYNYYLDIKNANTEAYIFVACTGRSGSLTMTEIFKAVEGCASYHEPSPKMLSQTELTGDKKEFFRRKFHKLKKVYIKRAAAGHKYYFESNHLFIKNFINPAVEYFGDKIRIIHLVRDPVSVARSLYKLNHIPGKTDISKYYYLDPMADDNLIDIRYLLEGDGEFTHEFFNCLWYFYEIEARIEEAKERHPESFYFKIRTQELNNIEVLGAMFDALRVPVDMQRLSAVVGTTMNIRKEEKIKDIDIEKSKEMNSRLLNEIKNKYGIKYKVIFEEAERDALDHL